VVVVVCVSQTELLKMSNIKESYYGELIHKFPSILCMYQGEYVTQLCTVCCVIVNQMVQNDSM
jgi:hypothetical protein